MNNVRSYSRKLFYDAEQKPFAEIVIGTWRESITNAPGMVAVDEFSLKMTVQDIDGLCAYLRVARAELLEMNKIDILRKQKEINHA